MTKKQLDKIIKKHRLWINNKKGGEKADLSGVDLSGADLRGVNLAMACLSRANLSRANLSGANLSRTNLSRANLSEADLSRANLSGANLSRADLFAVNLSETILPNFSIVPEEGSFIGFKKVEDDIVLKLRIPKNSKRTSTLIGRKCRAEFVEVLEAFDKNGNKTKRKVFEGLYNKTKYQIGKITKAEWFSGNIRTECASGIHFFVTRKEAVEYQG